MPYLIWYSAAVLRASYHFPLKDSSLSWAIQILSIKSDTHHKAYIIQV